MKNIKKIISIIMISLIGWSCSDELDISPFTEGDPSTFFNSIAAFQIGVDGAYSQLFNYYADQSGMQGMGDILSDNAIVVQTGRRSNEVYYDFRYTPNNVGLIEQLWDEAYEAVNVANLVIGQINNIPPSAERDNILGQALAARALAHFDLAKTYAKIPTQSADANSSLGIVYLKTEDGDTGDAFAKPARETVSNNYLEIIGDLETASTLIAENNGEGRFNRNAVFAILSKIYLYNGDYLKAIDAADKVSTVIATAEELPAVYTDVINTGVVFELSVNTTSESNFDNVGVIYSQSTLNDAGQITNTISEYAVDFEFFNSIDNTDARKNVIQFIGTNQMNNYNAIAKFLGETGQVNGLVDIKVIRAAEVLLNKAEALFELNREPEALETLDLLRIERFASFTPGTETGQALEDAIQYNRRVELAFEGHRFFDIKRRGESLNRSNFGDIIDGTGTPAERITLSSGDAKFQIPIPLDEINANSNLVQNPGY